jgi:carbon-monoxide dehydrogenase iron sulfur subunit
VLMSRFISVDPSKCIGCRLCELSCAIAKTGTYRPSVSRIRVLDFAKEGVSLPLLCRQCDECGPLGACPEGTISRDSETGAIRVDESRCVGCGRCSPQCPYGALSFNPDTGKLQLCDLCGGEPACVALCFTEAICVRDTASPIIRAEADGYVERMKSMVIQGRSSVRRGGLSDSSSP